MRALAERDSPGRQQAAAPTLTDLDQLVVPAASVPSLASEVPADLDAVHRAHAMCDPAGPAAAHGAPPARSTRNAVGAGWWGRTLAAGTVLLLVACTAAPSYRNASAPISSAALFESARFAGTWHEVAAYPDPDACLGATETWAPRGDGTFAVLRGCRGAWSEATAVITGPGRFTVTRPGAEPRPVWVLWIDQDYRTAVIGQPSGRLGRVLNREPQIPADRMAAAREILAFNGYDVSRLVTAAPPAPAAAPPRSTTATLGAAAATVGGAALAPATTGVRAGTAAAQAAAGLVRR